MNNIIGYERLLLTTLNGNYTIQMALGGELSVNNATGNGIFT